MKKILFSIFIVTSFLNSFGQPVVQRSSTANTPLDPNLFNSRSFRPPVFLDTVAANVSPNFGLDSCGKLIYTYNTNGYWYRGCNPKRWIQLLGGSNSGGSQITIINNTQFSICSYSTVPVCDTFLVTDIDVINTVTIINDSTLLVCDTSAIPVCDTVHIPPQNFQGITANSGVRMTSPTNVEFGGNPLLHNTTLDTRYNIMNFIGYPVYQYPYNFIQNRTFKAGTGIVSFRSLGGASDDIDYNNAVKLGIHYTGGIFQASPDTMPGYMGDKIGYMLAVNGINGGSFGWRPENSSSKLGGMFIHTLDTSYTDMVTFYGKHPPNPTWQARVTIGESFSPYRIMTLKDDKEVQLYGYPHTRNDPPTSKALYTDASGNLKYGLLTTGSVINIITDSSISICSPIADIINSNCDTIIINNIANVQTVTILNDSTIIVCDSLNACDTLVVPGQTFSPGVTANNGLRMSTPTNVQLGSPAIPGAALLFPTFIDAGSLHSLNVRGSTPSGTSPGLFTAINSSGGNGIYGESATSGRGVYGVTATGVGIYGNATSSGVGAFGTSSSGAGVYGQSTTGIGGEFTIQPATTNTIANILKINRVTSGVATSGIGGSLEFYNELSDGQNYFANAIISSMTNVTPASRTSQLTITGVDNAVTADLLTISGNGATRLNKYGVGSFTAGTPTYQLLVDASGNVMEGTPTVGQRFGVAGEDDAAGEDRIFDVNGFSFDVNNNGQSLIYAQPMGAGIGAFETIGPTTSFASLVFQAEATSPTASFQLRTQVTGNSGVIIDGDAVAETLSIQGLGGISVQGPITNIISYDANYGAGYTVRSLTDKRYVDSSIAAAIVGSGGWGNTGTVATLTGNSTLAQATFDFTFSNGGVLFTALAGNGAGIVAVDNNGRISFTAAGGSGNVNSGTQYRLGYYATTGTTISQAAAITASRALVSDANGVPTNSTTTTTQLQYLNAATGITGTASSNIVFSASPVFTGTVIIPSPFTLGATSVTTTGARLNFLTSAGGTTGTTSSNIVFSTSPTLTTPVINVGSDASFDTYYRNGAGLFTRLPNGTTGQVYTATTGSAPSWATPAAGGGITVGSTTITGGTTTRILRNNGGVVGEYTITGSGTVVAMQTSPTLITPILGTATATSINKVTITAPATSATLTILNGKTLIVNKTITLEGTDFTTMTFPSTHATIAGLNIANTWTAVQTFGANVNFGNNLITGNSITTTSVAGTTYTLLSSDNGDLVSFTSASSVTVTIPSGLPAGFSCSIRQLGAGKVTISTSGTTVHNYSGETKTAGQYAVIDILYESSNTYTIAGETGP